jgi:hypothetical protein
MDSLEVRKLKDLSDEENRLLQFDILDLIEYSFSGHAFYETGQIKKNQFMQVIMLLQAKGLSKIKPHQVCQVISRIRTERRGLLKRYFCCNGSFETRTVYEADRCGSIAAHGMRWEIHEIDMSTRTPREVMRKDTLFCTINRKRSCDVSRQ